MHTLTNKHINTSTHQHIGEYIMFNDDLKKKAIMVDLSISSWSARKTDKTVLKEITDSHGAEEAQGTFSKLLVAKNRLEDIKTIASTSRSFHNDMSLPWIDGGGRLLQAKNYEKYSTYMEDCKTQFEDAVDNFMNQYDAFIDEGRDKLGSIFNEQDYPSKESVKSKFKFSFEFSPVPESDDFRSSISDEFLDEIKARYAQTNFNKIQQAERQVVEDVVSMAKHAVMRLREQQNGKWFKRSTLDNIINYYEKHPVVDLLNNPDLIQFFIDLQSCVSAYSVEDIRTNVYLNRELVDVLIQYVTSSQIVQKYIDDYQNIFSEEEVTFITGNIIGSDALSNQVENIIDQSYDSQDQDQNQNQNSIDLSDLPNLPNLLNLSNEENIHPEDTGPTNYLFNVDPINDPDANKEIEFLMNTEDIFEKEDQINDQEILNPFGMDFTQMNIDVNRDIDMASKSEISNNHDSESNNHNDSEHTDEQV